MVGRAVTWGIIGLFISVALECSLPVAFAITVATSVIGSFDIHIAEYAVAAAAAFAVYVAAGHTRVTAATAAAALAPIALMAALAAGWLITGPRRKRRYLQRYATAGARIRAEQQAPARQAARMVEEQPVRLVIENHYHYWPQPPLRPVNVRGEILPLAQPARITAIPGPAGDAATGRK